MKYHFVVMILIDYRDISQYHIAYQVIGAELGARTFHRAERHARAQASSSAQAIKEVTSHQVHAYTAISKVYNDV
jgi:hypothetical protein